MIHILVTGAGAPGTAGTICSLRENPDSTPFRIITSDINPDNTGRYFSDAFYVLPAPESDRYLPELHSLIKAENINVIIPQTTREIGVLAIHQEEVRSWGCEILVSGTEAIRRANDKYLVIRECEMLGIPFPAYRLAKNFAEIKEALAELGFPGKKVVVKPRFSNGQRGVRILSDREVSMKEYLEQKPGSLELSYRSFQDIFAGISEDEFPELLVSEYLPGDEYTVDVFRNKQGMIVIPRLRKEIRSGISFDTRIDLSRTDLIGFSEKLSVSLDLKACYGFQFKLDAAGVPKILESNPRVQGTMAASAFAGFNMIYYAVMEATGLETNLEAVRIRDGVIFKRYWGGIGINPDKTWIGKI